MLNSILRLNYETPRVLVHNGVGVGIYTNAYDLKKAMEQYRSLGGHLIVTAKF